MDTETILILIGIGIFAGLSSGFLGVGGGIIIVPALLYIMKFPMPAAVGTSLFVITMPVAIMGMLNYVRAGHVNYKYGFIMAAAFVVAGYFGSKIALKINPAIVKLVFGVVMIYVAFTMIRSGITHLKNGE